MRASQDEMNHTWSFDSTEKYADTKEKVVQEAHKERDRRVKAVAIVKYFKSRLDETFPPRTSAEYLSALFRQKGVPSLDIFTTQLVASFRRGFGFDSVVEGPIRKIMSLASWSSPSSKVTMWTLEPVISSVLIRGNTLDVASAKANFDSFIDVIEPLSMTTSNTAAVDNQIRGR